MKRFKHAAEGLKAALEPADFTLSLRPDYELGIKARTLNVHRDRGYPTIATKLI